jgi:hypothetical protein
MWRGRDINEILKEGGASYESLGASGLYAMLHTANSSLPVSPKPDTERLRLNLVLDLTLNVCE